MCRWKIELRSNHELTVISDTYTIFFIQTVDVSLRPDYNASRSL